MSADSAADGLDAERDDLLFNVRRSIRYHNRRRRFFERWHITTNAVSVLFGSATILALLRGWGEAVSVIAAAIVTVFSTFDLVVGTSRMARLHEDLVRRFIGLERKLVLLTGLTESALAQLKARCLGIEADELPILRVLDALCYNEQARADGCDEGEFIRVTLLQRWLAQFFSINEHKLRKMRDLVQTGPPVTHT